MRLKPKKPSQMHPAVGFGSVFAGGMAFFALGGAWLDRKYGTEPWFLLAGVFMGFIFAGYELWKILRWMNREDKGEGNDAKKP